MIIADITFAYSKVPLVTPFKTALRTVENIEDLVICIKTECGQIGWGSAPSTPQITGDTHQSIKAAIENVIFPRLKGQSVSNLNSLCQLIQSALVGNTSAKAAVEIAVYDLWAKWLDKPLYQALGGGEPHLKTDITISVNDQDEMLADSEKAIAEGFDVLKIKIGKGFDADIQRLIFLAHKLQDIATLRLDVNQAWSATETLYALDVLAKNNCRFELVEQPVKANDIQGLQQICAGARTPIMADESAFSPVQLQQLINHQAVDIANIKLMKTGGLSRAIKMANLAGEQNIPCMIGCMLEGSIGVTAAAHFAVAYNHYVPLIDLDGPALGQYNPASGGARFSGPSIELSQGPGLGITNVDSLISI